MHEIFTSLSLTDEELKLISNLVYERFGIVLGERKRTLIIGRLQKILRREGFENFKQYYEFVKNETSGQALSTLIDQISTNHTFFYRESDHFQHFLDVVLPEIAENAGRNKKLRIWVAGCSSGEEPYTLAMLLWEHFGDTLAAWDAAILATDISTKVLDKAKSAIYPEENVSGMPKSFVLNYFKKISDDRLQVVDKVRKLLVFKRLNLIQDAYPFKGIFNVIFCRNVMIYFDTQTRKQLIERFARYMPVDSYLFIGHSESIGRESRYFKYIKPAVYKRIIA